MMVHEVVSVLKQQLSQNELFTGTSSSPNFIYYPPGFVWSQTSLILYQGFNKIDKKK